MKNIATVEFCRTEVLAMKAKRTGNTDDILYKLSCEQNTNT